MKKLFFTLAILAIIPMAMYAHPAKKVNLSYKNGKLIIEVIHPVSNAESHFIDQVVVNVDGKDVKTITLTKQTSKESAYMELSIPEIKKGSVVVVKTNCNKMGKKSAKLKL